MFFCWTIIAGELLLVFIISILSVAYIGAPIVFVVVPIPEPPNPPNIKFPVISRLLLYLLLTINLFFAPDNSLIISVFNSETLFEIILLAYAV